MNNNVSSCFMLMGSHLFDASYLKPYKNTMIFMAESMDLCTAFRYHKKRLVFQLSAMRHHAKHLTSLGFNVHYIKLEEASNTPFLELLKDFICKYQIQKLVHFNIEDRLFKLSFDHFCNHHNIQQKPLLSPLFLTSEDQFKDYLSQQKKPFMKTFYQQQRVRLNILLDNNQNPLGGSWSFDTENRKKTPKTMVFPSLPEIKQDTITQTVKALVLSRFSDHPGYIDPFWIPVTRQDALSWWHCFKQERFGFFGDYEDAFDNRSMALFHSVCSPLLNCGLLTPKELIDDCRDLYNKVPINSLEGFIRQIIGWREFIKGIDMIYGEKQEKANFWNHRNKLSQKWYDATTGLEPLDHCIDSLSRYAYAHHIERLMLIGNCMLLSEIKPQYVFKWFMELFIDSASWVMGPNVYGMSQYSDGGIFATKPYICGSNYLKKMSHFKAGDWCNRLDGLYWRFIDKNKVFFLKNPRLAMMGRLVEKMDKETLKKHHSFAEKFIETVCS